MYLRSETLRAQYAPARIRGRGGGTLTVMLSHRSQSQACKAMTLSTGVAGRGSALTQLGLALAALDLAQHLVDAQRELVRHRQTAGEITAEPRGMAVDFRAELVTRNL